ncbi:hypothetical protein DSECCO2_416300 [anaerobic digester metagenome]
MKMQRVKDVVMGAMVATLLIGAAPSAFAKVADAVISVNYNNIKVLVGEKELKTDKEPFTYEGTTYLPVRAVAEAVGKEVKWDSVAKTVTLTNTDEGLQKEETKEVAKEISETTKAPEDNSTVRINKEIIDENGVKIRCIDMVKKTGNSNDSYVLNFKLKNSTSMNYGVSLEKIYINDKLLEPFYYTNLVPTAEVTDDLRIYQKDLDSVGITEIKEIRLSFHVYNSDAYSESFDTKEATIKITK